eukprot:TCONS_00030558-protein
MVKYNLEQEEVGFPTADILGDLLPQIDEWECMQLIPGEKIEFPSLKQLDGVEIKEIIVMEKFNEESDGEENEEDDELPYDSEDMCHAKMIIEICTDDRKINETKVKQWLMGEELYLRTYEVNSDVGQENVVEVTLLFEAYGLDVKILESPFYEDFWNMQMNEIITEGVCYSKSKVPDDLRDSLRKNIDKLAEETEIDFHPNSNDVVRDLVHPALYSYIKGVSELMKAFPDTSDSSNSKKQYVEGLSKSDKLPDVHPPTSKKSKEESEKDFWGRPYEDSKFQWLPTPFHVSEDGKCSIKEYINNLDKDKFPEMYGDLEKLFEVFLPYFEEVWSYAKIMEFWKGGNDGGVYKDSQAFNFERPEVKFRDQKLQVIIKIVDYTLQPGQSYEGVWHAEGMSHENIVMTGIYFIDRGADLTGGDLRFKRAFHIDERAQVYWQVPQCRPYVVEKFANDGYMPLGHFSTKEGYLLVFPNCHIHKIAKFVNESKTKAASRRIVVFFFVNPEKKIISTREVAPQQGKISLSDAKKYRLELMAERKYDKEKLNVRDLELCEH